MPVDLSKCPGLVSLRLWGRSHRAGFRAPVICLVEASRAAASISLRSVIAGDVRRDNLGKNSTLYHGVGLTGSGGVLMHFVIAGSTSSKKHASDTLLQHELQRRSSTFDSEFQYWRVAGFCLFCPLVIVKLSAAFRHLELLKSRRKARATNRAEPHLSGVSYAVG